MPVLQRALELTRQNIVEDHRLLVPVHVAEEGKEVGRKNLEGRDADLQAGDLVVPHVIMELLEILDQLRTALGETQSIIGP